MQIRITWLSVLLATALIGCGGGSSSSNNATPPGGTNPPPPPPSNTTFTLSGSVGDGPIVDATIEVLDSSGTVVASTTSDTEAKYSVVVDAGLALPATIRASGGTDLVTGRAPDFELSSAFFSETDQNVNVSPVTSLITAAAICGPGLSASNLVDAYADLVNNWSFGIASAAVDPVADVTDASNLEAFVLVNEALGEVVRRSATALLTLNVESSEVIETLGCDLADGEIDGQVVSAVGSDDARTIAVALGAVTAVRLEILAGRLEVDGSDASSSMNDAVRSVLPSFTNPDVNGLAVTQTAIDETLRAIALLMNNVGGSELVDMAGVLAEATPATARSMVDSAYGAAESNAVNALAETIALSGDSVISDINQELIELVDAPVPTVTLSANPASVTSGNSTVINWSSTGAVQCFAAGGWDGDLATEGTASTGAVAQDSEFSVSCVGLGGTNSSSVVVTVSGGGGGGAEFDRIAIAGCSQTRDWVGDGSPRGFEDITGEDLFTMANGFGGGSVDAWLAPSSNYLQLYRGSTDGSEDAVLAQVCVGAGDGTTFSDVETYVELLAAEVPGKPIYLMPLDVSPQSSNCNRAGYDDSVTFVNQAVQNGIALLGPVINPPYAQSETTDGCHPNDTGAARMTETVQAWLDSL